MPIQPIPQRPVLVLSLPVSGTVNVACDKGKNLALTFDPAEVAFSREGSSLIISEWQGGKLAVTDFFTAKAGELPLLLLPDGDTVNSADFLASLNIDTSMAAGTPAPGPDSGGEGTYSDESGSLLNGVERLGSLGTNTWSQAATAKATANASSAVARSLESGLPETPGVPANVPGNGGDGIVFSARAVLYMHDEGTGAGQTPYSARSVTARALTDNLGNWETAGQTAQSIAAHPDNPLDVGTLVHYQEDALGNITFSLTSAGRDWMAAHPGEDIRAYYTVTDAGGASYVMQVVVSADEEFHSHDMGAAHNASLDSGGLIYGEWHGGAQTAATTPYLVTSSRLADELTFTGDIAGGDIAAGSGSDTVNIDGDMRTTSVFLGNRASGADTDATQAGDVNTLFVGGNLASSAVYGTAGTDRVTAGTTVGRVVVDDTTINTGSGAGDHVVVNGRLGLFDAGGLAGVRSVNAVTAADGVVGIHSRSDSHAVVAQSKNLSNLGAANTVANEIAAREIHVTAQGGASNNYAVYAQGKNTADAVHNKLTADTVEIAASGPNAAGLWADGFTGRVTQGYNEITGGTVRVAVQGTGNTYGIYALKGAENRLHGDAPGATLEAVAENGTNHAMFAQTNGKNLVDEFTDVEISAGGAGPQTAYALFATTEGENRITGRGTASGTVTLNAEGAGRALGMRTDDDGRNIVEQAAEVSIDAYATGGGTADGAHAMSANRGGTGVQNLIQDAGVVNLSAGADTGGGTAIGIWAGADGGTPATATDAANQISRVDEVNITVNGQTSNRGMQAEYGYTNAINAVTGKVGITAENGSSNYGLHASRVGATSGGSNTITDVGGDLTAVTRGTGVNHSLHAQNAGWNIVSGIAGQTTLTASGGTENTAVYAASAALNRLDLEGDAVVSATGNGTANYGLRIDGSGTNDIGTDGALTVTASGAATLNAALHAEGDGGANMALNILGATDAITLTASGGTGNYAMRAESKGQNSITASLSDPGGPLTLNATGGAGSTNSGISSAANGGNLITYATSVAVTATGGANSTNTAMGISQSGFEMSFFGNNITQTQGRVELTAAGGATAMGMNASGPWDAIARNLIDTADEVKILAQNATTANTGLLADGGYDVENILKNVAGDVTVTASGAGATNTGMSAANDGRNTIDADGTVEIVAKNGIVNRALSAVAGGENAVTAYEGVTLTTSGGGTRHAMYADGGYNTVTVTGPDDAVVKLAGAMESKNGGTNTVTTAGGDDLVTVSGAAKGVRTGSPGFYDWSNVIATGEGDDTVAVTGGGTQIVGLRVDLGNGNNLFASSAAASPITAGNQPSLNPHLWAGGGDQHQECDFRSGDGQDTLLFHGDLRSGTSVSSGAGDDLIAVKGTVGSSSIDAGSGANTVLITGSATSARFTAGSGDDTLTIEGGASYGAGGTIIDLGDGHNVVTISHGTAANKEALTGGSQLATGAGKDDIRLIGNVGGAGTNADGVYKSSTLVNTGAGDDHILIDGTVTPTGFTLQAGDGDDTLELLAADWTEFEARYRGWIDNGGLVGAKVEHLDVWAAPGTNHTDIPAWLHTATMGAGVFLNLHAALPDISAAVYTDPFTSYHYDNSSTDVLNSIAFGNGDDKIGIGSFSDGHVLALGNGNNELRVAGNIDASTVSFGEDRDTLAVGGDIQGALIDLKGGNDVFVHHGAQMTGVTLDGGSNDAVVHAANDGGDARLGDILGFGGNALGNMGITLASGAGNTITGFETLLADSSNGTADSIHLHNLLDAAHTLNTGGNDIQTLIIRGDADDTFSFDGLSAVQEARDVHIDGMDGLYTLYSVDDGGQELRVYLQTLVQAN